MRERWKTKSDKSFADGWFVVSCTHCHGDFRLPSYRKHIKSVRKTRIHSSKSCRTESRGSSRSCLTGDAWSSACTEFWKTRSSSGRRNAWVEPVGCCVWCAAASSHGELSEASRPCAGPPCQCHPHGDAQPPLGEGGEVKPSEGHHTGAPHSRNSSSVTVCVSAAALAQHQQLFVHRGCVCLWARGTGQQTRFPVQ